MENEEKQEEQGEVENIDFNKPDFSFIPKGSHTFRQSGYYLICKSCDLEHGVFIGGQKIMVGQDEEGKPILKDRKELGMS